MRRGCFSKIIAIYAIVSLFTVFINFTTETNTANAAGQKVAILFGMMDYPGETNDLNGPGNDMIAMEAVLEHSGYTVYRYMNYSKANLLSSVQTRASSLSAEDTLLFAYSGHGSDGGYIVAADNGFISISELESRLALHSGIKEVILDSCFSGDFISKDYQPEGYVELKSYEEFNDYVISVFSGSESQLNSKDLAQSGYYVMTACSGSQESFEYGFLLSGSPFAVNNLTEYSGYPGYYFLGLFNCYFHDGFGLYDNPAFAAMHADGNSDNRLSWHELYTYAAAQTSGDQQAQVYPLNSGHLIYGTAVTSVVLDRESMLLEVGQNFTLHATVYPEDAQNKNVIWSSNHENIATVVNGVVTGEGRGEAIITVTTEEGGYTDTCTVTVEQDYDFDPATGTILKYYGDDTNVVIPSSINSVPVLIIGEDAFEDMNNVVESITVPEGVTTLSRRALAGMTNSLHTVNLPESLITIGDNAFYSSYALTTVTIPSHVESIGEMAFANCTGLTSVTVPDSVTALGGMVFIGCASLESISVSSGNPNYKSVDGVLFTKDGTELIQYPCNKTGSSYSIPDGTVITVQSSFEKCNNLLSVMVPNGFATLGIYTFQDCGQLDTITFGDSLETIGFGAFRGCSDLSSITIPSTVTSLGGSAFGRCESLASIVIPSNIPIIDEFAFRLCTGLSSVTIAEGVEQIKQYAFEKCTGLASINIPSTISSIDIQVFTSCESLTDITVDSANTAYKSVDGVLMSKDGSLLLAYPMGKTGTAYTVPAGAVDIAGFAFYKEDDLTQVILPDGTESLGERAFGGCTSLAKAVIPQSVASMHEEAFFDCGSLTICGERGSYAETYATAHSIPFLSCNARLSDLTVNSGTVDGFSESVYTYNISVYYEMSEVQIGASASDTGGQLAGDTGTQSLNLGLNSFTVTCDAEDGINQKTYTLNITRNERLYEFTTSVYSINRTLSLLTDVADGLSPEDFRANLSNSPGYVKLYDAEGIEITPDFVGTGMTVKLEIDAAVEDELDILVLGDIDSNGIIDIIDYSYVKLHIFDVFTQTGVKFMAGDIDKNDVIDIIDYSYVKLDIFGVVSIN